MAARVVSDPVLSPELVERVLAKLGLTGRPTLDLAGLNTLFAAYCGSIPFDNIQKRVWFAGDQTTPLTGGNPAEFFEDWLVHGTGGTCWPINGGMCALVHSLGFDARRIAGSVIVERYPHGANHGSVIVTLDGIDYVIDPCYGSFKVLRLVPGRHASAGKGIHKIRAVPTGGGFKIFFYMSHNREVPLTFRTEPEHDPVDHAFFLTRYNWTKKNGVFNDALYFCRRFPDRILTIGRKNRFTVAADGAFTKTEIADAERKSALVDEFGLSEEIVEALPPDDPGGAAFA